MLDVGPGNLTFPIALSFVVSTAKTVLLPASKAAAMLRLGDNVMKRGELPALIGATGAIVSLNPLMMRSPPKVMGVDTPCEAKTRCCKPLAAGAVLLPPPHALRPRVSQTPTARARMRLFKRLAPKDMKKEDLIAKCRIITDLPSEVHRLRPPDFCRELCGLWAGFATGLRETVEITASTIPCWRDAQTAPDPVSSAIICRLTF